MAGHHTDPLLRRTTPQHLAVEAACKEASAAESVACARGADVSALHSPWGTSGGSRSPGQPGHPSTSLRPLAPRALPRFLATMDALTPALRRSTASSRAGLPSSRQRALFSHSVSNHLLPLRSGISGVGPDRTDAIRASPFTRGLAGAAGRIEFACATDWLFTLGCSPPPLTRTQLPLVSGSQTDPGKDFHLAGLLRSKAHECDDSSSLWFLFLQGGK